MPLLSGLFGKLIDKLLFGAGDFVFKDLTNNVEWKALKKEYHLTGNNSDFADRYAEELVALKQAGKSKALLQFYAEKSVVDTIRNHWYGTIEPDTFHSDFENLTHHFTLDKQLDGFSARREIASR